MPIYSNNIKTIYQSIPVGIAAICVLQLGWPRVTQQQQNQFKPPFLLIQMPLSLNQGYLNPFVPNAPFLYPLKTLENFKVF